MNNRNLSWGLLFIVFGAALILHNLDYLDFHWRAIWKYWPLILIFIGLDNLFKNDSLKKYSWLYPVIVIVCVVLLFVDVVKYEKGGWTGVDGQEEQSEDTAPGTRKDQNFSLEMEPGTTHASFDFTGGGVEFKMTETTPLLVEAVTRTFYGDYSLRKVKTDSLLEIEMNMSKRKVNIRDLDYADKVTVKLNPELIWDIDLNTGACNSDLDLSAYMLRKLEVSTGAAALDIKLGNRFKRTDVDIETGASKVTVRVPATASCLLNMETVLSSKTIRGFVKKDGNRYESENYNPVANQIVINIDAGVSDINIERY